VLCPLDATLPPASGADLDTSVPPERAQIVGGFQEKAGKWLSDSFF
jgi:hypothetical protein